MTQKRSNDGTAHGPEVLRRDPAQNLGYGTIPGIESLQPRAVIAGHQRAGRHDGPEIIEETRRYIRDFDPIAESTETARELYDQVLALYPELVNPGMLWWSARALKPGP